MASKPEPGIELQTFVTQALVQIVKGIEEANRALCKNEKPTADDNAFLLAYSGGDKPMNPNVQFDVAVTVKQEGRAGGELKAKLYVFSAGVMGAKTMGNENVSRVKFEVLVKEHQGGINEPR